MNHPDIPVNRWIDTLGGCKCIECAARRRQEYFKEEEEMNNKSKKREALDKAVHQLRRAAIEYGTTCHCCLVASAVECHEMPAGSYRHNALEESLSQMHLCHDCHKELQATPIEKQVAIKLLAIVNSVNCCFGSERVAVEDVVTAIQEIAE
jgi:hypothetical protein